MRITNKIMQNNSLRNINTNKELQSQLSIQMQTGNKLTRPSDDPIIAIRSLRLSSNLTKVTQYYERNAEDAEGWLKATEEAIFAGESLLEGMYKLCNSATSDDKNTSNYMAILMELKQSAQEFYDTGDESLAGRNLFTGYRTESTLQFQEGGTIDYSITEEFSLKDLQTRTHIDAADIYEYTEANGFNANETMVETEEYTRFRLAYDDVKDLSDPADPNAVAATVRYFDPNLPAIPDPNDPGKTLDWNVSIPLIAKHSTDPGAYAPGDNEAYLLADTGEVVFGKNIVQNISTLPNSTTFSITYEKDQWVKGDLRPEHYFDCDVTKKAPDGVTDVTLHYDSGSKHAIQYDLGANQSLQVNTTADEIYVHDVGRDVEDLEVAINQLQKLDNIVNSLEEKIATLPEGADLDAANLQLTAAKKAQSLVKDQVQKLFGSTMTSMQSYQDLADLAGTKVGTTGVRLDLIKNRLESQQAMYTELYIENNHKEIEDSTTELASAKLTYDAALAATAKILSTSLMNYI